MKYIIAFTTFYCLLVTQPLSSQVITIRDELTRETLEQVALFSVSSRVSAVTDARGTVEIAPFAGADSIRIEMIGYVRLMYSYDQLVKLAPVLYLKQVPFALDEVVVSATRWRQARNEVPIRMITLSRSDASLRQSQTAADMLAASGEVYVQKSQLGGGSPMIRGFATNRVLLAVDGVRMNTAIFRGGNVQNIISIDPFSIERAEVLFGPGSVMYGSDAVGGVMSFTTITPGYAVGPSPMFSANAAVRTSSANTERTGHVSLRLGLERWAFASGITWSEFGDLRMGSVGPDEYLRPTYVREIESRDTTMLNPNPLVQKPTGYSQLNLMQKVRFRPDEKWDIQYGGLFSTTGDYSRYDRLLRSRGTNLRSAEWYYGPQLWMMHSLGANLDSPGMIHDKLNLTVAYQRFEESRHDRDFGASLRRDRFEAVDAYSVNLDMEKDVSERDRFHYGLELIHNRVASSGVDVDVQRNMALPGPSRYPDGSKWTSWALYADYRRKITESFILHAGIRYNRVALTAEVDTTFYPFPFRGISIDNGALNGSLGAVYAPGAGWQLNANLSTGFRAPNIDDAGKVFDSTPGQVVVPNPDLRPEFAYNAELSASRVVADRLKTQVTAYSTWLDNALVRRPFTFNGRDSLMYAGEMSRVQAIQNAAYAIVRGLQADIELRLPLGIGLISRINYQHGIEELDDGSTAPLRHAAPWFGSTHITWRGYRFKIDFHALYNGEVAYDGLAPEEQEKTWLYARDALDRPYSPAWYTLNLKGRYRVSDYLTFGFGIENIMDHRYRPYSSGITAPGRNVIGSMHVRM
jgi:hemoglobin/transferrin/lactoferrin receptor protein